jgi:hypothetical protein
MTMIRRLDLTDGQIYTMVIGVTLAVVLAVAGIPAVLRTRPLAAAATVNALNPRAAQTSGESPAAPAPSTSTAPATRTAIAPVPGTIASPTPPVQLPPGVTGSPRPSPALRSITTFAIVGHPGAPGGLAIAPDGTVYVPTNNGSARGDTGASHVFSYDVQGTQRGDVVITGQPSDHADGLTAAAVDPISGALAVVEQGRARILSVDTTSGGQRLLTQIPDLPACLVSLGANPCQQGADDRKAVPTGVAYDAQGNLFIADAAQDTVWRLRPGQPAPEVWYQSTYFAMGDGPHGLAWRGGALEFTVGTTLDPSAPAGGALYRVGVNADGTPGALTLVALFPRGDEPGPLAIGSSGTAYVVLRATGAIVAIAPTGSEEWRITPPGDGSIALDAPSALALVAGQLLVANQGSGTDASRWAVLAVAVNDGVAQ